MSLLKKRVSVFLAVVIVVCWSIGVFADNAISNKLAPPSLKVFRMVMDEPENLDPQLTYTHSAHTVLNAVMEGLMRFSGGKLLPGMANKVDVSADGLVYTFHLRNANWSDGAPVTAEDFEYAWKRALDPNSDAEYAFLLHCIKNGLQYNRGKVSSDKVGVKAIDKKTLRVTLEKPTSYFLDLTTYSVCMPARKDLVAEYGEYYFAATNYMVTNGPFSVAAWELEKEMLLVKNNDYWNQKNIKLDVVRLIIDNGDQDLLDSYLNYEIDTVMVSNEPKLKQIPSEVKDFYNGNTFYLSFNQGEKTGVLKNTNIRKALALAIDRSTLTKETGAHRYKPARGFVAPDVIPGKSKPYRTEAGELLKDNDVKAAKEALALGLKELKLKKLPTLTVLVNNTDSRMLFAKVLTDMWKSKLGVTVQVNALPFAERMNRLNSRDYQMSLDGWGPDYKDPLTYLDMFATGKDKNQYGFNDSEYNKLIEAVRKEHNNNARMDMLVKAEKILINKYVVAPLYFSYEKYATRPYIKNLHRNPLNTMYDFVFVDMDNYIKPIKSDNGRFEIKTDSTWDKNAEIEVPTAALVISDIESKAICTIVEEKKSIFPGGVNLSSYEALLQQLIEASAKSIRVYERKEFKLGTFNGVDFKSEVELEGGNITYYIKLIETPTSIIKVTAWTYTEDFNERLKELDSMMKSFRIVK